jgi:hypothetical protein
MYTKKYKDYLLILGEKSVDLFNHFKVNELHGLSKKDALSYPETNKDAYIFGMVNYSSTKDKFPYIFINLNRLNGTYKDYTGIMHECVHLSLLLNDWQINSKEEKIVSDAENYANTTIEYIKSIKNESWFGKLV